MLRCERGRDFRRDIGLNKGKGVLMGLKGERDLCKLWRDEFRENAP